MISYNVYGGKFMDILIVSKSYMIYKSINDLFKEFIEECKVTVVTDLDEVNNIKFDEFQLIFIDINHKMIMEDDLINILNKKEEKIIIIIDINKNKEMFIKTIGAGADGYMINIDDRDDFIFRMKKIINGKKHFDLDLCKSTVNNKNRKILNSLTKREEEVIELVCKGLNNREIGCKMHISEHTSKKYLSNIFSKLNLKNRKELIIYMKDNC